MAFVFHGNTVPEIPGLAIGSQSLEIVLALYKEQNLGMFCICPFFSRFLSENKRCAGESFPCSSALSEALD